MLTPEQLLERKFPNLTKPNAYQVTSPPTGDYNCVAWSAGVSNEWWWPEYDGLWPPDLPRENTLDNFIILFGRLGYEVCPTFDLELSHDKVAIYVDQDGKPTHMARQLPSGAWTSKLGPAWDIEHADLQGVECAEYGQATIALRKHIAG